MRARSHPNGLASNPNPRAYVTTVNRVIGILAGASISLPGGQAIAGAWVTPTDEAYARVGIASTATRHWHDFDGKRQRIPDGGRYEETYLSTYVAMGIERNLELSLSLLAKHARLDDDLEDSRTRGLGDIGVGLKLGLGGTTVVRSVQVRFDIPTFYDDEEVPPLGDGQLDVDLRGLLGASLWSLGIPGYVGAEAGYRHRAEDPGDGWVYMLEAGVSIFEDAGVRLKLDGQHALELPRDASRAELFAFDSRLVRLDATVWFEILGPAALEVGYVGILSARNVTGGDAWTLGVSRRFTVE